MLLFWLFILILLSAFFSSSETGLMRINRYRLKFIANGKTKHSSSAKRVQQLLERPDRLLGLILLGNNFVNILAAFIFAVVAERLWGNSGFVLLLAPVILTVVVLIFAELTPKTLATMYPEKIAYPSTLILKPLLTLFYPMVWIINSIANGLLKVFGIQVDQHEEEKLNPDELRTVVNEASPLIPPRHQKMLLNILDLENATVEDIMIPRREIVAIDIEDDWETIVKQIKECQHTRLLVFKGEIDNPVGMLHARDLINLLANQSMTRDLLISAISRVYFVPEGTPLHTQLLNFQRKKLRIGAVVDEYGDIQGLVTLEDILEEIVGEFTTDLASVHPEIIPQNDKSLLVDCGISLRELNRTMKWKLPIDGPKTLNGLITEYLEFLPEKDTCFRLFGYPMMVVEVEDNMLQWVQVYPELYHKSDD
ncbi:MAG: Mg2+/Co2+ transporter CorB [Enterobacterales bacterium]|jgi:Mg2+/Co2+ transporter CorB